MIACPACGYPNDDLDHRCERCGRKFEQPTDDTELAAEEDVRDEDLIAGEESEYELVGHVAAPPAEDAGIPGACAEAQEQAAPETPAAPPPKPRDEVWRAELSSRLQRFRERRAQMQESFTFPEVSASAAAPGASGSVDMSRKVIPFEEIRDARRTNIGGSVTRALSAVQPVSDHVEPAPQTSKPDDVTRMSTPASSEPAHASAHASSDTQGAHTSADEHARATTPVQQQAPQAPPPAADVTHKRAAPPSGAPRKWRRIPDSPPERPVQPLLSFDPKPPTARPLAHAPAREQLEIIVAPVVARAMAAAMDLGVLTVGYALFFAAYTFTGGRFPVQRAALAGIGLAVAMVVFVFYLTCLSYGCRTPGMYWVGLELVDFEGRAATRPQRRLRLLGVLASFASLGVGFLWALADEDGLTWHDRISRTCPTLTDSPFVPRDR